ncbi:hypothetical protein AMIS_5090 [Actinoplanes missouriensis 431]|uniref:DUF3040 domain-containing protein n=1 Tax=Actinoplanes missouriensis (strain ATCC 14538 / DSM 43046 / CBS 188.64 / JCM 3121 / NBRC 102363 / NCIMB 12654 / NRRL B-3342 / UNCC 431) TaxID=512565 RepID=I0GY92_ACTM4|nr:DUF3040 domain-containing protein [Actinoplanes missouriensis]BAL85729.1 hypothetical protein AMIS_5090 [Actinoplanes missouriensis 431]
MLSKEDNRRLAQLERQLQRDDPEFCARMGGGNFSVSATGRPPLPLFVLAAVLAVASLVCVLVGWLIAGLLVAAWSIVTAIAAGFRWRNTRRI